MRITSWVLGAAILGAGCGADGERDHRPRPPAPITVTAAIAGGRIHVSPQAFGAGPIVLLLSNQTPRAQILTLESDGSPGDGPGLIRRISAIPPAGTATLAVEVRPGRYRLGGGRAVQPASLRVGAERPSTQNTLLTP